MIKTAMQLRAEVLELWPRFKNFWPFDPKYQCPTMKEMESLIEIAKGHSFLIDYVNRGPVEDCDNAALYSSAIIHHQWARLGKPHPCPYGRAMGFQFRGGLGSHSLNICFTEEGIYFIDFDAGGRKWKASAEKDSIFYLELS